MMVTNNCLYQCHRGKDCCPKVIPFGTVLTTKTDESEHTSSEHLNTPSSEHYNNCRIQTDVRCYRLETIVPYLLFCDIPIHNGSPGSKIKADT